MNVSTELGIKKDEVLAKHCRFGVGGDADFFVEVTTAEQIRDAIKYAKDNKLNYFVYGGGSNLFFDDKGFRGLVIRIIDGEFKMLHDGLVHIDAGYPLPKLIRDLAHLGWGGLEFLANIPGSVGGAVVGNAGCYGKAIQDVLAAARVYSVETNKVERWKPKDFEFGYRHSVAKYDADKIILNITLKTIQRPPAEITQEIEKELTDRQDKHPHNSMCAGSFFKNPENMSAWKVITEAGMADAKVGDAGISPKHANFLVNNGKATSADILKLARNIRTEVKKNLNIDFEPEVRYVGKHGLEKI